MHVCDSFATLNCIKPLLYWFFARVLIFMEKASPGRLSSKEVFFTETSLVSCKCKEVSIGFGTVNIDKR